MSKLSFSFAEMREIDGHRKVEIVNPWPTLDRQQDHSGQWTADLRNALPAQGKTKSDFPDIWANH